MDPVSSVERRFIETVRSRELLPENSRVAAAVSGGSDSVALFRLLVSFSSHMNWSLEVLHVDHGAREESGSDAEFVRSLARERQLPFYLHEIVPAQTGSLEDHFSRERQRIYASLGLEGALVATGHTADDRAETVVMRLLEGAGLRGLGGMDYLGRGPVRRPLLDLTRGKLRDYLRGLEQPWIEDPTNREADFLRNRIRRVVMPALESVSPGSAVSIARSSANLTQWRDLIEEKVADSLDELIHGGTFTREKYASLPRAVRLAVLWTLAGKPRGGRLEIEKTDRWILSGKEGFHILPGGKRISMKEDMGAIDAAPDRKEGQDLEYR